MSRRPQVALRQSRATIRSLEAFPYCRNPLVHFVDQEFNRFDETSFKISGLLFLIPITGIGAAWLSVLGDETAKALPSTFTGLILLALGWLVTSRVTAFWDRRKKESELSLAALERFYALYGEFFAVWKVWEHLQPKGGLLESEQADRDDLLKRAAAMEGNYESLIVKLTVERDLGQQDLQNLASFREGLQCLRESIEANKSLRTRDGDGTEWRSATKDGDPERAKAYRSFKTLAVLVSDVATHANPMKHSRRGDQAFWRTKAKGLMAATNAQERLEWWRHGLNEP